MNTVTLLDEDQLRAIVGDAVRAVLVSELVKQPQPAPAAQSNDYITRKQAAQMLNCSLVSIHAWAKQGKVKLYHFAGKTFLKKSEVLAAMKPVTYDLIQKGGRS